MLLPVKPGILGPECEPRDEEGAKSRSKRKSEKPDQGPSEGQLVAPPIRAGGLSSKRWHVCCVSLQTHACGVYFFLPRDLQHLMFSKYMETNENGLDNWGDFVPQLLLRRGLEPPEDGQVGNKWKSIQDQAAGTWQAHSGPQPAPLE